MTSSPVKVLIAEWVPSLNKGELAILIGMLRTFQALGEVDVSIFSFFPSLDEERYPKNVRTINVSSELFLRNPVSRKSRVLALRNLLFALLQHFIFIFLYKTIGEKLHRVMNKNIWKEYCRSDIIVICHDQVSCTGGFVLDFSPIYITFLAKALHKTVVIYANGTYDFGRGIWAILATYVLNNVDLITTRTEESFSYLRKFVWNKARIYFTGDPAILLTPVDSGTTRANMTEENIDKDGALLVGAALSREVLSNALQIHRDSTAGYQKAVAEIARLLDRLVENLQATIAFIPHCIEPYYQRDDRTVARDIYNRMKNKHRVRLLNKEYSPEELKGITAQFDLFLSTRVHAVIDALSMGVPSITLTSPTDRRADGLVGKSLKQEKWIHNVENLDADKLFADIIDLQTASDEIRKALPTIIDSAKEKALLNGILLRTLLDSRLTRKPGQHCSR